MHLIPVINSHSKQPCLENCLDKEDDPAKYLPNQKTELICIGNQMISSAIWNK